MGREEADVKRPNLRQVLETLADLQQRLDRIDERLVVLEKEPPNGYPYLTYTALPLLISSIALAITIKPKLF